jgi:hypothetical protein
MSYFVVVNGSIQDAVETLDEANARAAGREGATVIGDEWLTLADARERVDQAKRALDEVAALVHPEEAERMRATLAKVEAMLDEAWQRMGLAAD